jgi:cell division protein FtsX
VTARIHRRFCVAGFVLGVVGTFIALVIAYLAVALLAGT